MNLAALTLHDASEKLRRREISAVELTGAVFQRIDATGDKVHAYLTLDRESAVEQAQQADARLRSEPRASPLLGIPIAVKDNFLTRGLRTTCASKILRDFMPPYDATTVAKLRDAGAVIVGKTNLDEFAMGSSAENSGFFPTHNPWNLERIPGGSSGGSAAAVAADQCIAAVGTDTGGSIRQPAACCGVVGLKPTYGRVSRYGIIAFASSMDQVGPITKDVRDAALLLQALAGHDPADSTSSNRSVPDYSTALNGEVKGLRLGVPKEYFVSGMQPEVEQSVRAAIRQLEKNGAKIEENVQHRFLRIVADDGSTVATHSVLLGFARGRANNEVGQDLRLHAGSAVYWITRALHVGARALVLDEIVLPAEIFAGLDQDTLANTRGSWYSLYESTFGVRAIRAREQIKAVAASEYLAKSLKVVRGAPLLRVDRVTYPYDDRAIEWRRGWCKTDSHHYINELS